jgi:hypothetical protein
VSELSGLSDADLMALYQKPAPAAPDLSQMSDADLMKAYAAKPSEGSSVGGIAKSLGTGLAEGVIGLAGMPGDLYHMGLRALGDNLTPESNYGSNAIKKGIEGYTGEFYKPKGVAEETASKIGQFAPAVIGGPETLGAKLLTRAVAPAVASEAAGKLTEGTAAQPYAELAGALAGGVGGSVAANKFKAMAAARNAASSTPTAENLLSTAGRQFEDVKASDLVIKPAAVEGMAKDIKTELLNDGFHPDSGNQKGVFGALDRLEALGAQPGGVTPKDLEVIRKNLVAAKTDMDGSTAKAARDATNSFMSKYSNLGPADVLNGDANKTFGTLKDAIGNYAAGKRSNTVMGKANLAQLNSDTAGSGANVDNAYRQAIKQLVRPINNDIMPKAQRLGFNAAEIAALNTAARGTTTGNIARYVGKAAPTGIVSAAMSGSAGHLAGGPIGAVALPVAGYIAKKIGDLSTKRAVAAVDSLVRSRSPLAAQVASQLSPQIINQLPAKSQQILQTIANQPPAAPRPMAPTLPNSPIVKPQAPSAIIPAQAPPIFATPKVLKPTTDSKLPSQVNMGPSNFKTTPILGENLWHETSPSNAARLLEEDLTNSVDKIRTSNMFVTNNKDIAIGQSGNGVKIELDGGLVSAVEHKKPGTGALAGREYRTNAIGNNAIKNIEIAPGETLPMRPSWQNRLDASFKKSVLSDGTIRYERKR